MLIGGQDILLPTTMVGNYPNPRWYDGHGFATLPRGEVIHDSISKEAFEDVVGAIVHDQEAAGLDVISDGKVYGGDSPYGTILYYYLERMSGYKLTGPPIGLPIYSTLYSPTLVGEDSNSCPESPPLRTGLSRHIFFLARSGRAVKSTQSQRRLSRTC